MKIFNKKQAVTISVFLLPSIILYSIFFIVPIFQTFYLSFFSWNGIKSSPIVYTGWDNFNLLFQDETFYLSLKNVLIFILGSFILIMPFSFILALIITSKIKGKRFFRISYFIPSILPLTALGLLWQFLLKGKGGLINNILVSIGLDRWAMDWLGDPDIAIFSVVAVNAWIFCGLNMIIFASGIVSIPEEIYEAATIDGANGFQKVIYITVPLMKEIFKIFSILAVTQSIRVFAQVYVMTGGGPNGATEVPTTMLYNQSFVYNNFGGGNAIATFIVVTALVSTVVLNRLFQGKARSA
ncbi:sugar ABC transporter permease [Paenibacillus sp. BSR1-1]|uniref:carbohydrate ABC transporter permease n=1 Tax=Paenibacillus sp. BSR1-1 TaxID=3020845 RepID=UPI0025B1F291|nr:sugar ABC transporter permease [Paenibacillus sp. BSR1-1]MDN3020041.1 sugar ABC transporter permease [Paenibacillus sp. BSR1-1]